MVRVRWLGSEERTISANWEKMNRSPAEARGPVAAAMVTDEPCTTTPHCGAGEGEDTAVAVLTGQTPAGPASTPKVWKGRVSM